MANTQTVTNTNAGQFRQLSAVDSGAYFTVTPYDAANPVFRKLSNGLIINADGALQEFADYSINVVQAASSATSIEF